MDYRRLGRTGLKISALGLGSMQWGWTADEQHAFAVMDAFVERGGNFIDSADFYSRWIAGNEGWEAEAIIGRWMKLRGNRAKVIIATKVYQPMGPEPNDRGLSRKHIIEAVEASLRRLQTDYIDLYQAHAYDDETPIDETLSAFDTLLRAGKVRYIGASNYTAWRLVEALWRADVNHTARYESLQPHYNLVNRAEFEQDLKLICERYGLGVTPYSPLAGGFLTGKYQRMQAEQRGESARAGSILRRYNSERAWNTIAEVQRIAQEIGTTPAVVSLAWLMAQPVVTAPIIGANTVEQLQANMAALDVKLSPEHLQRLDAVSNWKED
jgi:aryl-alcohol dehydrogenase-like predicted oxidoreductase